MNCSICGGSKFKSNKVLWKELINEWQISKVEADYINRQQGKKCNSCGANIRSIALAKAIQDFMGTTMVLNEVVNLEMARNLHVLEINEAGTLSPILKRFAHYSFGAYPEVDIHTLPYEDAKFDLVVHSDTLEHVKNPIHALSECYRVLKPGGALCFTIPVIVGRMTRNREGLPKSFHGNPKTASNDFVVQTEFGADAWTYILEAGFKELRVHAFEYPAGIAFSAYRSD